MLPAHDQVTLVWIMAVRPEHARSELELDADSLSEAGADFAFCLTVWEACLDDLLIRGVIAIAFR